MKDFVNLNWDWDKIEEDIISSPIISETSIFPSDADYSMSTASTLCESQSEFENLMMLNDQIEDTISKISDYVTYNTMWQGRVLEVLQDYFVAMVTKQGEDRELFIEIAKNALEEKQLEGLVPGASFNWAFGHNESKPSRQIWKLEFLQSWKLSEEAINQMAAKMIEGFEHFYEKEDRD